MGTAFGLDASLDTGDGSRLSPEHTLPPTPASALQSRLIRRSGL
jgi:hypothetical protein